MARTAYPNLLDTRFLQMWEKSWSSTITNRAPIEHIWTTWTDLLTNVLDFWSTWCCSPASIPCCWPWSSPPLPWATLLTHRINPVGLPAPGGRGRIFKAHGVSGGNHHRPHHAKDIRIFGLRPWLDQSGATPSDSIRASWPGGNGPISGPRRQTWCWPCCETAWPMVI